MDIVDAWSDIPCNNITKHTQGAYWVEKRNVIGCLKPQNGKDFMFVSNICRKHKSIINKIAYVFKRQDIEKENKI